MMKLFPLLLLLLLFPSPYGAAEEVPKSERVKGENTEESSVHTSPLKGKPRYEAPLRIERKALSKLKIARADNPQQISSGLGKDTLVGGKVFSVDVPKSEDLVILNFGPNAKNCFKVVVFKSDFDAWGKEDASAMGALFKGKSVLAGGTIALHRGMPQIVACAPSQLLVVEQQKPDGK